ncbi:MarR family winged helix-turn-helix transcriptional regulator [Microlunatus antarcticus]|uniref:DNA-binding MarR family transcriptional regulator n=1 Tax=Microlunatus antarcticus TaxID=53388 RepID=A0A7W5JVD2_9ACTN|nr:DNA-binding MarR family transcriptional regulator [Microlunatus antarcticus]
MDTPWLDDREQQVWRRFAAVLELLPGVLDSELVRHDSLTHFDYFTLAMLSEAPDRTLRMGTLAGLTNASLARLSNVVTRLASRGLVERKPSADDRRATDVALTEAGWAKVVEAAPGHVRTVRSSVFDLLDPDHLDQLSSICERLLDGLDPQHRLVGHGRTH